MEKKLLALATLLVLLSASIESISALRGAQSLCNMTQDGLLACEPAVTTKRKSQPGQASAACCTALAKANLPCLCSFKNNNLGLLKYLNIDPKLVTKLPFKCNLKPPSEC